MFLRMLVRKVEKHGISSVQSLAELVGRNTKWVIWMMVPSAKSGSTISCVLPLLGRKDDILG